MNNHKTKNVGKQILTQTQNYDNIANNIEHNTNVNDISNSIIKKSFPVLGMHCVSCAINVENILKSQSGIINAEVNFASSIVTIEYNSDLIKPADFQKAVQSVGYDLLIEQNTAETETIEDINQKNIFKLKKKLLWALSLSVPIIIIDIFFINIPYSKILMWILSTPVVLWSGKDFFINAYKLAKHRAASMDTLVAMSIGVAYIFSIFNLLFPDYWHEKGLQSNVYFESAAVITTFILLGKFLEEKTKRNTLTAIKKLIGLQPKTVTIIQKGGHQMQIPVEQVKPGDIIMVKPGEKVAVDGIVLNGSSYVDESMLNGEPIPVVKTPDAKVYAGSINQKGSFQFRADKVGSETMLAQIIKMVSEAQNSKAPVQKLVDKIAGVFVPVVIGIGIISFIVWNILGGDNGFTQGILSFITVLVIACPCALGLATPTAIIVGIGKGSEKGILIKDAECLENLSKVNAIILDKTGTITEGKPVVTDEFWADDNPMYKQILYSIEKHSEHPLADAISKYFYHQNPIPIIQFENIPGKGVKAFTDNDMYLIGNLQLLKDYNIQIDMSIFDKAQEWNKKAQTIIWFANSSKSIGIISLSDQIKQNSKEAIQKLQKEGIAVYMLTGDNLTNAKIISEKTGISYYKAEMLPEDKTNFVKKLQDDGKIVAMVGDGINDSIALAQSDVGIAMGKGSDIAIDVAKITIVSSDLLKIVESIKLSKATVLTIKQNLFWAFIYNIIGIPIAAGILYPINGFLLNPMIAGAAMAFSSVSVVMNSLLLKWKK